MHAVHGTGENLASVRVLVIASASFVILYWRTAIKVVIVVLVTTIVVLIGIGAVALVDGVH
jgi:hypothetical protein